MAGLGKIFGSNRKTPQALSGRGENGVTNGRRHHRQSRLADAGRLLLAHHHVDFRLRSFAHARHFVIVEIGLLDAAILDGNGIVQSGGETVDGRTLDLSSNAVRINAAAASSSIKLSTTKPLLECSTERHQARGTLDSASVYSMRMFGVT